MLWQYDFDEDRILRDQAVRVGDLFEAARGKNFENWATTLQPFVTAEEWPEDRRVPVGWISSRFAMPYVRLQLPRSHSLASLSCNDWGCSGSRKHTG